MRRAYMIAGTQGETDMTNYAFMAKRIRSAKTPAELDRHDKAIERLFLAGVFSTNQFSRLDGVIVDQRIAL
jgi:hypothetical protein